MSNLPEQSSDTTQPGIRNASERVEGLRVYLVVFFAALFGCMAVTALHLMSPDEELIFRTTESIATRGSLDVRPLEMDPASGQLMVPVDQTFATVQGRRGRFYVQYLPAQSVLAVPLVWLADATAPLFANTVQETLPHRPRHFSNPDDPRATWRRAVVVLFFNPIVTALTAVVLARLVLFLSGGIARKPAIIVALAYVFGTMALPHSRTYFTEPLAGLFILFAVDCLLRWYTTPLLDSTSKRRLLLSIGIGLGLAAAIWTRMDSPFLALGVGLTLVGAGEWKRRRESAYGISQGPLPWKEYATAGALTLGAFALLLAFNSWRYAGAASFLGGGYSGQEEGIAFSTPFLIGLHGYLASPGKGLFFFSPALVLGLWGWLRAPRHLKWTGAIMLACYLPFILSQIKWQNWDGGWCWGPRHLFQIHAPLMLGMVFLFTEPPRIVRKAMIYFFLALGGIAALIGSLQSPMDFYEEFFLTPRDGLYFNSAHRPGEAAGIARDFAVFTRDERGQLVREVPAYTIPAPMVDSLYIPQHTQWVGNLIMLRDGQVDVWLLRPFFSSTHTDEAMDSFDPIP